MNSSKKGEFLRAILVAILFFIAIEIPNISYSASFTGTGFFISNNGYIVTNHHVIQNAAEVEIKDYRGQNHVAKIIHVDRANDLALLKVEGDFLALPIARSNSVRRGDSVFTLGFPNTSLQGHAVKLTDGTISSISGIKDEPNNFQVSVPIQPGNSGGPLINRDGFVVGVIVAKLSAAAAINSGSALPDAVNYAVKSNYLLELIGSDPNVESHLKQPIKKLKEQALSDIVAIAEQSVVFISVSTTGRQISAGINVYPELRIGIDPTYEPFTFKTSEGRPTGFDVDIANALCEQIKRKCVFVEQAWDGMIPGLLAKKYDVIISSMSITEGRMKHVDFTDKYYNTPSKIVLKKDIKFSGIDSIKGKKVGVLKASTQEKYALGELKTKGVEVVSYDAQDQVYLDIKAGRLDGTVADALEVHGGFLSKPGGENYQFVGDELYIAKYFGVGAGVALQKGQSALKGELNAAINSIRSNGKYKAINDKYFRFDVYGK
jgi:arginine/ornithine transport system substrate-binding protein